MLSAPHSRNRLCAESGFCVLKRERFEDIPVWNVAIDLAQQVYSLTQNRFFSPLSDLRDHLRKTALSISNSIAEGLERDSVPDLLAHLSSARDAAGEVRSMLHLVDRCTDAAHLDAEISLLKSHCESCSRQLRAWMERLQQKDAKGPHQPGEKPHRHSDSLQRATEYQRQLADVVRRRRPNPEPQKEEQGGSENKAQDLMSRKTQGKPT